MVLELVSRLCCVVRTSFLDYTSLLILYYTSHCLERTGYFPTVTEPQNCFVPSICPARHCLGVRLTSSEEGNITFKDLPIRPTDIQEAEIIWKMPNTILWKIVSGEKYCFIVHCTNHQAINFLWTILKCHITLRTFVMLVVTLPVIYFFFRDLKTLLFLFQLNLLNISSLHTLLSIHLLRIILQNTSRVTASQFYSHLFLTSLLVVQYYVL